MQINHFQLSWTSKLLTLLMNSTEVQNPRRKLDVFGSLFACAKSDQVFQKLSYSLCGLCLSLLLLNSSSHSKAFLHFIVFSGSSTAVHCAFLCFDAKAWPQSQTLFMCIMVLHCGHTVLRCIDQYYTVGIPSSDA